MVMKESEEKIERGEPVPNFELRGTDGETHTLADFADYEAVLLVFTCNHCPYAQAKFDLLNELAAAYDDAAVVGINPNDAEEYPDDEPTEIYVRDAIDAVLAGEEVDLEFMPSRGCSIKWK